MIVASKNDLLSGDVVVHTNSGRVGSVIETRPHRDGTVECRIRISIPSPSVDSPHEHEQWPVWWNSKHLMQVPRRDPYRRYLAMCAAEDDQTRIKRRLDHLQRLMPRRRFGYGPHLSEAAWMKAYWRLCNLRMIDPGGMIFGGDLGREHWRGAANDCLDRRDRARSCGTNSQGKSDVHPQRIALADRTVFSRGSVGETGQDEPAALGRLRCPSCGASLVSEPVGAPLRCTRCAWYLLSRDEWRKLSPFRQGYVFYMQAEWPTSELRGEQNPHTESTPAWEEFGRGEWSAMLDAQDGEE